MVKDNNICFGFYVKFIDKGNPDFSYQFPRIGYFRKAVEFFIDFITFVKKHELPFYVEFYYLNKDLKTTLLFSYGNENE